MKFYNSPEPELTSTPYEPLPPDSNPVIRGNLLKYAASLITSFGPLQDFLWYNAGFHLLHTIDELNRFEPRFDPTVIPVANSQNDESNYDLDPSKPLPASDTHHLTTLRPPPIPTFSQGQQQQRQRQRYHSILDFHDAYVTRQTTPSDLVAALIPLIVRDDRSASNVQASASRHAIAFLDTNVEAVIAAAAASTRRYERGEQLGLLDGVPVAVKDEVDVDGCRLCFGTSMAWDGFTLKKEREEKEQEEEREKDTDRKKRITSKTSWCVRQWVEAGAILLGKTNMHELGIDTTNNNPTRGTPLNPHNSNYYTGGSSGGSGYAVSAGIVPIALGADGGGSIRIPSSYCGIYGLKPTHGRISCWPTQNRCPTNGVVGPMAANMVDLEVAYRIMAANPGTNATKSATFPAPSKPPTNLNSLKNPSSHDQDNRKKRSRRKVILGIYNTWFDQANPSVQKLCHAAITYLVTTYPEIYTADYSISIPYLPQGQVAHAATILCEIANSTSDDACACLSPAARVLVAVGRRAPARDLLVAQRMRALLMGHMAGLFAGCREQSKVSEPLGQKERKQHVQQTSSPKAESVIRSEGTKSAAETVTGHEHEHEHEHDEEQNDPATPPPLLLILSPTTPTAGARITKPDVDLKHGVSDANASFKSMTYTYLANFTGVPALSVPVGYAELGSDLGGVKDSGGSWIPVGMQAMGPWGAEEELIEWGYDIEEYLNLHLQHSLRGGDEDGNGDSVGAVKDGGKDELQGARPKTGVGRVMPGVWVDALRMAKGLRVKNRESGKDGDVDIEDEEYRK